MKFKLSNTFLTLMSFLDFESCSYRVIDGVYYAETSLSCPENILTVFSFVSMVIALKGSFV